MTKYNGYQRAMMGDAARTARSAANTERHLRDLSSSMASSVMNAEAHYTQMAIQADIARATEANNRLRVQQLQLQRQQLEEQQNETNRRRQEELKRDHQAFAMWRQTEDGKAFVDWYVAAKDQADAIAAFDGRWRDEADAVKAEWASARQTEVDAAFDDPRERNAERSNLYFIAAGACFLAWVVSLAMDVVGLINGLFILGILVFGVAGIRARIDRGRTSRGASQVALREQGAEELGFDPFSDEVPAWGLGDPVRYAHDLIAFYTAAYTQHPPASTLPQLQPVQFVTPDTIRCDQLRALIFGV